MTLSEIIESNESDMEDLECLRQVPQEVRNEIEQKYNEINEILERCIDEYGDEDDISDEPSEDDDED